MLPEVGQIGELTSLTPEYINSLYNQISDYMDGLNQITALWLEEDIRQLISPAIEEYKKTLEKVISNRMNKQ